MAALATYLENKLVDHVLRNTAYTPPTTVYVALFTADDGLESGVITSEVSGGAYARVAVTFDAPTDGATANSATLSFPTATVDWGTVTHAALMDASTAGNVLIHGALTTSKIIQVGDTFQFTAGNLDVIFA